MGGSGKGKSGGEGGLFGLLQGKLGKKKEARVRLDGGPRGGDRFVSATRTPGAAGQQTNPLTRGQATIPLSTEEKAKQSEERRYLISAYESNPRLIPEFQNAPYMYKLISQERDHVQEVLAPMIERRRLLMMRGDEAAEAELNALDREIQEHRNELARLFKLIKRVAGVQKSGTGGTHFLDPMQGK